MAGRGVDNDQMREPVLGHGRMPTRTRSGPRSRDAALARRIALMQAALKSASADNSDMRRTNADLRRELAHLHAENSRLRAALDADRQQRTLPEMTAGTSIGPRRPHQPPPAAS